MNLKEYYDNLDPEMLWLPQNPHWTQFRIGLDKEMNNMKKIKDVITDRNLLLKWLREYQPYHVFYMTSKFLDPTIVNRKGPKLSQNLFLFSDEIILDIDRETLQESKTDTLLLDKYLKEMNIPPYMYVYSGKKGFHLHIKFDYRSSAEYPIEREQETLEVKKSILYNIQHDTGLKIDTLAGWNTRGIMRLPGTIHGKTGNLVEIIQYDEIKDYKPKKIVNIREDPKFKDYI